MFGLWICWFFQKPIAALELPAQLRKLTKLRRACSSSVRSSALLASLLSRNREAPTISPVGLTHRTGMSCVCVFLWAHCSGYRSPFPSAGRTGTVLANERSKLGLRWAPAKRSKAFLLLQHTDLNGLDYLVRGVGECRLFRLLRQDWGPYDQEICGSELVYALRTVWEGG